MVVQRDERLYMVGVRKLRGYSRHPERRVQAQRGRAPETGLAWVHRRLLE